MKNMHANYVAEVFVMLYGPSRISVEGISPI